MKVTSALILALCVAAAVATVYFEDNFANTNGWEQRWVTSEWKKSEGTAGVWDLSAGTYHSDAAKETGLHTSQDARFYSISTKFDKFSNKDDDLVIQFSVKHQQLIDCGGGYIKLLPEGFDQTNFNGETAYNIMFGPDICGSSHRIVHFILNRKGTNHLIKRNVAAESDEFTHVYTALLKKDNTYAIYVDGELKQEGSIEDDWSILPPKEINDPSVSKPADWVDEARIDDPEDVKPADWDDQPREIPDPEAKKPEDWDDELDGEWEAPTVPNPEYRGPWRPRRIDNPAYKGPWVHPQIPNPEYSPDSSLYSFDSHAGLGIEIWQVKAGSIFSNFLVTNDLALALERAQAIKAVREGEQALKAAADAKAAEEAAAAQPDAEEPAPAAAEGKDDL